MVTHSSALPPVRIKNCGLMTPDLVSCALSAGANFIGLVHHASSPRHLEAAAIAALYPHIPTPVARVLVLVSPSDDLLDTLPKPDFWQIHGVNDPARIAAIRARTGIPVITAVTVEERRNLPLADTLESVSAHLLFDATHGGGAGVTFDWSLLAGMQRQKPWFLAGGLNADNVAAALLATHAPMVDVSSGIESAPGVKSAKKIMEFNQKVRRMQCYATVTSSS